MISTVGFTGTSAGLTNDQTLQVHMLLGDFKAVGARHARHGMCEGADANFDFMAHALRYVVVGHPGVTKKGLPWKRMEACRALVVLHPKPFLSRNRDIVEKSDIVIACPKETEEQWRGSGTWATIRYAKTVKKPLITIWPDGSGVVVNVPGGPLTVGEFRSRLLMVAQSDESRHLRGELPDPRD